MRHRLEAYQNGNYLGLLIDRVISSSIPCEVASNPSGGSRDGLSFRYDHVVIRTKDSLRRRELLAPAVVFATIAASLCPAQPSPDPSVHDVLLMHDGSLVGTPADAEVIKKLAPGVRELIASHSKTHDIYTSPNGRSILFAPRHGPNDEVPTLTTYLVRDWTKPEEIQPLPCTYDASFIGDHAISALTRRDAQSGSRERLILIKPDGLSVLVVPGDVMPLSYGPRGEWAGWDGKALVLGQIVKGQMKLNSKVELPEVNAMHGFCDGRFFWIGDDDLLVTGSKEVPEGPYLSNTPITSIVHLKSGTAEQVKGVQPDTQLSDHEILSYTDGDHLRIVPFLNGKKLEPKSVSGLRSSDSPYSLSPSGSRLLVLRPPSAFAIGGTGWTRMEVRVLDATKRIERENLAIPKDGRPVGWLRLEPKP
jgi:hypothetical protein